jgi:predicted dehydrogenase
MKKVNIGLIGGGLIGRTHTIGFNMVKGFYADKARDISLKVLAEENEETAKSIAGKLGIEEWVNDWRKLCDRDDIDVIYVAVPNFMHKEIILELIKKGKNIFSEKPLALNGKDAKEIFDAADKKGIKHAIGFNYRRAPAVQLIKKWVKNGTLGEIITFRSSFIQDWGLDENTPINWRFEKAKAGTGSLGDLGSHVIDMSRFLVGEPVSVIGIAETHIKERPLGGGGLGKQTQISSGAKGKVDVDDVCDILMKFDNRAQGSFTASRLCAGRKNHFEFEIYGSKGGAFFDWERPSEVLFSSSQMEGEKSGFTRILVGGAAHPYGEHLWPIPGMGIGFGEPFAVQMYEFIDSIMKDRKHEPNFYDGYKVNAILDGIVESYSTKSWVNI